MIPSVAPTSAPTSNPSRAPTDDEVIKTIYMYYKEEIKDAKQLAPLVYLENLQLATYRAIDAVLNIVAKSNNQSYNLTIFDQAGAVHGEQAEEGGKTGVTNEIGDEIDRLNISKYKNNYGNVPSGTIQDIEFCSFLQFKCLGNKEYDDTKFTQSQEYEDYLQDTGGQNNNNGDGSKLYEAFGTLVLYGADNVEQFESYLKDITEVNQGRGLLAIIMNNITNGNASYSLYKYKESNNFQVMFFKISETSQDAQKLYTDKFAKAAFQVMYGLYGFMILCFVIGIAARIQAWYIKSDVVKETKFIFFGIWTWDFVCDLIFATRAFEQGFYRQSGTSALFVFVPWFLNMIQLIRAERKWIKDPSIKFAISRWLMKKGM